jgi:hypothetical protein
LQLAPEIPKRVISRQAWHKKFLNQNICVATPLACRNFRKWFHKVAQREPQGRDAVSDANIEV